MANDDPTSTPKKQGARQNFTVRLEDEEMVRLEKCAEIYRKQTGAKESAAGLARTFIQNGLIQFERHGGMVING